MTLNGWLQIFVFLALVLAVTKPLGVFMARVFSGERTFLDPVLRPIERLIYRVTGVDEEHEMRWTEYAISMLLFSAVSMLVLYLMQRIQGMLPFNPQHLAAVGPEHLAFNTAASFTTNTNWQAYSGETTMSYFTQMAGLAFHNFTSAATGIVLAIAFIRGIARRQMQTIGNFWVDFVRCCLWLLLPFCVVGALFLVSQGVVQNLKPYDTVKAGRAATGSARGRRRQIRGRCRRQACDGHRHHADHRARPGRFAGNHQGVGDQRRRLFQCQQRASFRKSHSAHEPVRDVLHLRHRLGPDLHARTHDRIHSPRMGRLGCDGDSCFSPVSPSRTGQRHTAIRFIPRQSPSTPPVRSPAATWKGKETRFGIANSALFATVTTDASCGAINGWHDSFTPLGGMVPLVNIMLSEVIFGGVGSGMYGILIYIVLAVFIAGLMVGRTPEYLGKKIEAYDVKMAMLVSLVISADHSLARRNLIHPRLRHTQHSNPGPHGLSQILYAFVSSAGNNGSAFGGLTANTLWYDAATGLTTLIGRFFMIIPMLAIAGNLAQKRYVPPSLGTFPVTTPLFSFLLISVILILGALTFFPALSLGPILEHLLMYAGKTF